MTESRDTDFAAMFEKDDLIPHGPGEMLVPQGNETHLMLRIVGIVGAVCVLAAVLAS